MHIIHGDMKETVSGCFFSEHSVVTFHALYSRSAACTLVLGFGCVADDKLHKLYRCSVTSASAHDVSNDVIR